MKAFNTVKQFALTILWLLVTGAAFAQSDNVPSATAEPRKLELITEWLMPQPGAEDALSGVKVESVTDAGEGMMQRIEISLPKYEQALEEVIVIGKRNKAEREIPQLKQFEYINDPDAGRYGLVIYLGKRQQFALRLNYHEENPRFPYD